MSVPLPSRAVARRGVRGLSDYASFDDLSAAAIAAEESYSEQYGVTSVDDLWTWGSAAENAATGTIGAGSPEPGIDISSEYDEGYSSGYSAGSAGAVAYAPGGPAAPLGSDSFLAGYREGYGKGLVAFGQAGGIVPKINGVPQVLTGGGTPASTLPTGGGSSSTSTDEGEGMSTNMKIGIGVGVGALVLGGLYLANKNKRRAA
jgi:hypothetical protein